MDRLESRQYLATLNVQNYGAVPNDGQDDRNAIVAAINASNDGDTIFFPAGTYQLSKEIGTNNTDVHKPLGRGRTYKGETTFSTSNLGMDFNGNPQGGGTYAMNDRTVLLSTGSDPDQANKKNSLFNFRETNPNPNNFNVKFTNLTLRGRPFNFATNVGAMVEGVIIDNCHLDVQGAGNNVGVEFTTGLRNTQITNNVFHLGGSNGIYGYNWDHLTIANNWFLNPPGQPGSEGIHVIAHLYSSPNLTMEQNYFSGIHRMGIEYQGGGVDTIVQDNWYENPNISATQSQNADTFAYSIVADRSLRTITRRNVAIMPTNAQAPDGKGVRIVFELGGKDLLATDNYTDGGNDVIAVNGSGSTGTVTGNRIRHFDHMTGNNNGSSTSISNNGPGKIVNNVYTETGPNVVLTFDPFATSRLRPEPNKRYGEIVAPPTGVPTPTGLTADAVSSTQINLNWSDQAIDETGYRIRIYNSSDVLLNEIDIAADSTSYSVTGLSPASFYKFRVLAVRNAELSNPSNEATATTIISGKPATPTNLVGTTVGLNQVNLTWNDNATNEVGYRVERLSEDGVTWVVLTPDLLPANTTSYSLTSLASGRTFQFRVFAVNGVDDSEPSNIAVVQTPLAESGTTTSTRAARPAFFYSGSASTAVGPTVTGAS